MLLHAEIFTPIVGAAPPFATNNDPQVLVSLAVRTFVKFGFLGSPPMHDGQKKAPDNAGAKVLPAGEKGSVTGRYRRAVTAEAVIEAQGDHIHILADPVVNKSGINRIEDRE